MNPMMQVIQTVMQLKQNPQTMGQFLLDKGMIKQDQLDTVNQMNGDFAQVGNFLMSGGAIPQQQAQGMIGQVNQIQRMMN